MTSASTSSTGARLALLFGAALILAFLVAGVLTPTFLESNELAYGIATAIIVVAVFPIVVKWRQRRMDFANAAIWFLVSYVLHFGIGAYQSIANGSRFLGTFHTRSPVATAYIEAQCLALGGLITFWIGYESHFGQRLTKKIPTMPTRWDLDKIVSVALVAAGIGIAARLADIVSSAGGIAEWLAANKDDLMVAAQGNMYLFAIEGLVIGALMVLFIAARLTNSRTYWTFFGALLLLETAYRLISGSRAAVGFMILQFVMLSFMVGSRSPIQTRKYTKFAGVTVGCMLLLYPITSSLRFGGLKDPFALFKDSDVFTAENMSFLITERFHGTESLGLVVDRVPTQYAYDYGEHSGLFLVSWIPRAVWKDKPEISFGKWFRDTLVPKSIFREGTSVAITLPGEFYYSFGVLGVLVGMMGMGVLIRAINVYFIESPRSLSTALAYSFLLQTMMGSVEAEFTFLASFGTVCMVLILGVILSLRARGGTTRVLELASTIPSSS